MTIRCGENRVVYQKQESSKWVVSQLHDGMYLVHVANATFLWKRLTSSLDDDIAKANEMNDGAGLLEGIAND